MKSLYKKELFFFQLLVGILTILVTQSYACLNSLKGAEGDVDKTNICKMMLHVSQVQEFRKVDFIFLLNENFIKYVEANDLKNPIILNLEDLPMYGSLKYYSENMKSWSRVTIRAKNNYLYFTFQHKNKDKKYDGSNISVNVCDHEIELTEEFESYQISVQSIQGQNSKIHFSHKEQIVYDPFSEYDTKVDSEELLEPKYQQDKLVQSYPPKTYTEQMHWLQVNGLSYLQSKTKNLFWNITIVPLFSIVYLNNFLRTSLINLTSYTLFFGSYMVSSVLGAGNQSQVLGSENESEAHKDIPSKNQERTQIRFSGEDIFDFMFEKKKLVAIGVVSLCAAAIMISCAICNYGMLKLKQACSSKKNSSQGDELKLLNGDWQARDIFIPMAEFNSKNKKTFKKQKAHRK